MICRGCKCEIPDGAEFCPLCGVSQDNEDLEKEIPISPEGQGNVSHETISGGVQGESRNLFLRVMRIFLSCLLCITVICSSVAITLLSGIRIAFESDNLVKIFETVSSLDLTPHSFGYSILHSGNAFRSVRASASDPEDKYLTEVFSIIEENGVSAKAVGELLEESDVMDFVEELIEDNMSDILTGNVNSTALSAEITDFIRDNRELIREKTGYVITEGDLKSAERTVRDVIEGSSDKIMEINASSLLPLSFAVSPYPLMALSALIVICLAVLLLINKSHIRTAFKSLFISSIIYGAVFFSVYMGICAVGFTPLKPIAELILSVESTLIVCAFSVSIFIGIAGLIALSVIRKKRSVRTAR